jgi:RNA polymerase sigma-70 factor, ECF subfamily
VTNSDAEMLNLIENDDLKAFEEFYFHFHPRLFAYARKFIEETELAKDIVQEVFAEFWERRNSLDIKSSLSGYLFRTVHNKCLNLISSQKVRNQYSSHVSAKLKTAEFMFYESGEHNYNSVFYTEIENIVKENVQGLPEACRQIFELSRFEGFDNQEIADKLQISVRTVENQVYKALKTLKEALRDYIAIILIFFPFF